MATTRRVKNTDPPLLADLWGRVLRLCGSPEDVARAACSCAAARAAADSAAGVWRAVFDGPPAADRRVASAAGVPDGGVDAFRVAAIDSARLRRGRARARALRGGVTREHGFVYVTPFHLAPRSGLMWRATLTPELAVETVHPCAGAEPAVVEVEFPGEAFEVAGVEFVGDSLVVLLWSSEFVWYDLTGDPPKLDRYRRVLCSGMPTVGDHAFVWQAAEDGSALICYDHNVDETLHRMRSDGRLEETAVPVASQDGEFFLDTRENVVITFSPQDRHVALFANDARLTPRGRYLASAGRSVVGLSHSHAFHPEHGQSVALRGGVICACSPTHLTAWDVATTAVTLELDLQSLPMFSLHDDELDDHAHASHVALPPGALPADMRRTRTGVWLSPNARVAVCGKDVECCSTVVWAVRLSDGKLLGFYRGRSDMQLYRYAKSPIVSFAPDSRSVALGYLNGDVVVLDLDDGAEPAKGRVVGTCPSGVVALTHWRNFILASERDSDGVFSVEFNLP